MNHRSEEAERIGNGPARKIFEAISQAEEVGRHAKERVLQAGASVRDKIDAQREPAARRLGIAADAVRHQADSLNKAATRAAHNTADKLDATADYIRSNDTQAMVDDVLDVVRKHPGPALACAAIGGFLMGRVVLRAWRD